MLRSEEFEDGADRVREPQFESVQQQAARNYQQTSVLDNLRPNPNGMAQPDYQRRLMGINSSQTGLSDTTFDKRLWLRNREPTLRSETLNQQ